MRADRLVAALLVLQAKGQVTAAELAAELEVSLKTARRDLEALSMAGFPVYAIPGRGGGWRLAGDGRTDLSGLTAAEARALFLIAGPQATLSGQAKSALRKLVRALPTRFRAEAKAAAEAVVLDPAGWGALAPAAPPHLDALQRAVVDRVQVQLGYGGSAGSAAARTVHPLGIAAKGGTWYLLADTATGRRTFRIDRIRFVSLTDRPAVRPSEFDFAAAWRDSVERADERRRRVRALVVASRDAADGLILQFGADARAGDVRPDGRIEVHLAAASTGQLAERLAGWGNGIEVVAPDALRRQLAEIGSQLVEAYHPDAAADASPPRVPRASARRRRDRQARVVDSTDALAAPPRRPNSP